MDKTTVLLNYNGEATLCADDAVAKYNSVNEKNSYYIKRSGHGFFFNEVKSLHDKASRPKDRFAYAFIKVSEDVFLSYLSFLKTKSQVRANATERLYNEESAQRVR